MKTKNRFAANLFEVTRSSHTQTGNFCFHRQLDTVGATVVNYDSALVAHQTALRALSPTNPLSREKKKTKTPNPSPSPRGTPPAGTAAAAQMEEEGFLEVRCAGCGDTLEVERGLTEFACPSCATPQALPPELMPPPPPRPRRALPLGLSAAPAPALARVPCGGCGAVLAVPWGIRRLLACPLCGAEIDDVDGRDRFAAYSSVQVISPPGAVVLAATSSRLLEVRCSSRSHCTFQGLEWMQMSKF